ncbi:MAG: 4-hydroxy-3-methylbut-2-en-1-yl diphosphate synthase [Verrucomicrobia bacterium]|nr:MAG: 4-hydroxy-3-methylbut-2-en-1-yl diphosphate synthase [Verrucomicrobiota bacterium]
MGYCASRFRTIRRQTREVMVGDVGVGGSNPIRIQSMTTSDTKDVAATVAQCVALAEVGCEIIRITAPNVSAARCLKAIRRELQKRRIFEPLVADIHFLPAAALEAVEHVEKVRINPGNYADRKQFDVREYSEHQYNEELERLHDSFSPLVKRCLTLGRSMRIGTNHGSLSDRIMNRYGDTPLGMVESALEFLRIAESHGYRDLTLSMKASNPKVMIQAYRLLVERMAGEGMEYPLHLGVTEAGDGEDGRIKGAIGIGSLLLDGLGDTIRVSLTEDSVHEVPVARAIADKAMALWQDGAVGGDPESDSVDPYSYGRRGISTVDLGNKVRIGVDQPPRVLVRMPDALHDPDGFIAQWEETRMQLRETPIEGILIPIESDHQANALAVLVRNLSDAMVTTVVEVAGEVDWRSLLAAIPKVRGPMAILRAFERGDPGELETFLKSGHDLGMITILDLDPEAVDHLAPILEGSDEDRSFVTTGKSCAPPAGSHATGRYRRLAEALRQAGLRLPIWIRVTEESAVRQEDTFLSRLLEASLLSGSLLCDGIGDLISFETETDPVRSTRVAYNLLQGAGARISKTEFVACPSCGRTLFDLQTTTQRIREQTGHLKGVKIAIMGCIVNGPGEMADADFGYVGGAPGKINLYVGKTCVQTHIPAEEADRRLIDLIREHGKWMEPEPAVP